MDEELFLFDRVIVEFKKEWNPEALKNTIDEEWDHVLIQAFFFNLGKKLGFDVGCEKFRKWDVAWFKEDKGDNYVQVEIELGTQTPIAKAFSKICRMSDALHKQFEETTTQWDFFGILVISNYLDRNYFFDLVFDLENSRIYEIYYPKNKTLDLLVIDIGTKASSHAKVGPERKYQIIDTRSL